MAKYYPINESSSKAAHDAMSMQDYKAGGATEEYRRAVDRAYDLADRVAEKRPEEVERAYRLAERYSKMMAEYYNKESSIGMMCPSILVSGAGNFPVRKKEKQVAAYERNHEFYEYVQGILDKIERILYGKEVIKSGDERAVEKLEEKLEDLKNLQERMKAANKAIRLKDIEDGNDQLRELGYSEKEIAELRKPDYLGRTGYPDWALSNNNANIHRTRERLESLKMAKETGGSEVDHESYQVVENTDIMRIQFVFDADPGSNIKEILHQNGFHWAPSLNAWQRTLTSAGKSAAKRAVEQITAMQSAQEGDN